MRGNNWITEDPSGISTLQSDTLSSLLPRLKTVPMAAKTKLAFSSLPGPFWFHFSPPLSHTDLSAGSSLCCQGREEWEEAFLWAKRLSFAAPTLRVLFFDSLVWFTANMLQCGTTPQLYFLPLFVPLFPAIVELFDLFFFLSTFFRALESFSISLHNLACSFKLNGYLWTLEASYSPKNAQVQVFVIENEPTPRFPSNAAGALHPWSLPNFAYNTLRLFFCFYFFSFHLSSVNQRIQTTIPTYPGSFTSNLFQISSFSMSIMSVQHP